MLGDTAEIERRCIALIGMMLSGKSTVGAVVAERLGWSFVDADEAVAARAGKSIPDIFEQDGEEVFRRQEQETLVELLDRSEPLVIATGGGAMENAASRQRCRERAFVVYLEAAPAELAARLPRHAGTGRPLLDDADDPEAVLAGLLARRRGNYLAAQHLRLQVANVTARELAAIIVEAYQEQVGHGSNTQS